jgi:hypothetical protein
MIFIQPESRSFSLGRKWKRTNSIFFSINLWVFVKFLLSIYDSNESMHGKSIFFIEVLDELRLFIDKKVIFSEKKFRWVAPFEVLNIIFNESILKYEVF